MMDEVVQGVVTSPPPVLSGGASEGKVGFIISMIDNPLPRTPQQQIIANTTHVTPQKESVVVEIVEGGGEMYSSHDSGLDDVDNGAMNPLLGAAANALNSEYVLISPVSGEGDSPTRNEHFHV